MIDDIVSFLKRREFECSNSKCCLCIDYLCQCKCCEPSNIKKEKNFEESQFATNPFTLRPTTKISDRTIIKPYGFTPPAKPPDPVYIGEVLEQERKRIKAKEKLKDELKKIYNIYDEMDNSLNNVHIYNNKNNIFINKFFDKNIDEEPKIEEPNIEELKIQEPNIETTDTQSVFL